MKAQQVGTGPDSATKDLVVFSIVRDSKCAECGKELPKGSLLFMENRRALCLHCSDLDHLVYLAGGDAALTRRAKKYSTLSAVVVRFSRSRRRYELLQARLIRKGRAQNTHEPSQETRGRIASPRCEFVSRHVRAGPSDHRTGQLAAAGARQHQKPISATATKPRPPPTSKK